MLFINKIDHLRKLGDLIACVVFFIIGIYLYKIKYYKISSFIFICATFDAIFTLDAIKINGLNNILNLKLFI